MTNMNFPSLVGSIDAMTYPAFVEIKYDGMAVKLIAKDGEFTLMSKGNTVIKDVPWTTRLKETPAGRVNCVFLAELYVDDGRNHCLYKLLSQIKHKQSLKLAIYDVIWVADEIFTTRTLIDRKELLFDLLGKDNVIESVLVENQQQVMAQFAYATETGYEGVVVKSLNSTECCGLTSWVKMKNKDQNDYEVISVDQTKERIVIKAYGAPGSGTHVSGIAVGVKCSNRHKKHIKQGDIVTIEHCGRMPSGSLRHPVLIPKKEWI